MGAPKYTEEQREHVIALAQQGFTVAEIAELSGVGVCNAKNWAAGHHNYEARKLRKEKAAFEASLRATPDVHRPLPPGAVKAGGHIWLKIEGWGAR
jgi:transcriptional regulator with XRE-family HTH domain